MYQITLKIDGMACSMCESHVCDTIRNQFKVKKVSASHAKGELDPTGYKLLGYACEPYEKKGGLFSIFKK
jgi:cation transport ATPase